MPQRLRSDRPAAAAANARLAVTAQEESGQGAGEEERDLEGGQQQVHPSAEQRRAAIAAEREAETRRALEVESESHREARVAREAREREAWREAREVAEASERVRREEREAREARLEANVAARAGRMRRE